MSQILIPSDIILYDNYGVDQKEINEALSKYSRIRDYSVHIGNESVKVLSGSAYIVLANIVASALNSSLASVNNYPDLVKKSVTARNFPSILPQIQTNDINNRRISELWKTYRKSLNYHGLPQFFQTNSMDANFVYCEVPKSKRIDPLLFTDFTSPFDVYTWISLITTAVLVTLILGRSKWLITLSALLGFGVLKLRRASKFRFILVIWMLGSCVLTQLYLGKVTSLVIIPPEDDTIATIVDLQRNNYTLIFESEYSLGLSKEAYQQVTGIRTNPSYGVLSDMVQKATFWKESTSNFFNAFLYRDQKYAAITYWPEVIQGVEKINEYARGFKTQVNNSLEWDNEDRSCYIGEELIPLGHFYFGFLPPKSERLLWVFQNLVEAGIWDRWWQEILSVMHSERVQDRVKVKGPTDVLKAPEELISRLKLNGKVVKIFVLFSFCTINNILSFIIEIVWNNGKGLWETGRSTFPKFGCMC